MHKRNTAPLEPRPPDDFLSKPGGGGGWEVLHTRTGPSRPPGAGGKILVYMQMGFPWNGPPASLIRQHDACVEGLCWTASPHKWHCLRVTFIQPLEGMLCSREV